MSLSKGIEPGTLRTVSQLIATAGNLPPSQIVAISVPNLSMEIAMRQPTAAVVASEDVETAKQIARACHNEYFRPYVLTDLVGVEVAGGQRMSSPSPLEPLKGWGSEVNTRATLITRGLAEMTRLGVALGRGLPHLRA